jgi:DNA-binding transcriptional MerR regulator
MTVSPRLLSIGEFAAATQLSQKALRIYDEQRLLMPARIDAASGYRYYTSEQVSLGRLVRTLREMNLSLNDIGRVLGEKGAGAETVLADLAREIDERYAREKRAHHAALLLLHRPADAHAPAISERARPETTVAVRPFTANRYDIIEKFRAECGVLAAHLTRAGLAHVAAAACALTDPLSDDEGHVEAIIPVNAPNPIPQGITLRRLPAASCARVRADVRHAHTAAFAGALDALFDWFDRRGYQALDAPLVSLETDAAGLHTEILWAFEKAASAR